MLGEAEASSEDSAGEGSFSELEWPLAEFSSSHLLAGTPHLPDGCCLKTALGPLSPSPPQHGGLLYPSVQAKKAARPVCHASMKTLSAFWSPRHAWPPPCCLLLVKCKSQAGRAQPKTADSGTGGSLRPRQRPPVTEVAFSFSPYLHVFSYGLSCLLNHKLVIHLNIMSLALFF